MGEGRRLLSITKDGLTTSYQYDASGNRIRVTYPDGSYTKYCILDGRVIGEIVYKSTSSGVQWSHGVRYIYGDDGSVVGFGIWDADTTDEWERYYFVKNLQGDVLKVYRDADNALVASYEYDPFGNILSATGEMADENPFRYRGYHYDTNTGFYYLQSRYYDPLTCRFINADTYASTGQGVIGWNMFAYCGNNPVAFSDPSGNRLVQAPIEGGCGWTDLFGPWRFRIDQQNTNTKTKRHIHVQNTRTKEEYIQNDDGSPHDEGRGQKGKLPSRVQKALIDKAGWDYNGNRKRHYEKTSITVRDDGTLLYVYADGTQVIAPYTINFASTSTMESIYLNSQVYEINSIPIGMPFIETSLPILVPGWGTVPVVPAF